MVKDKCPKAIKLDEPEWNYIIEVIENAYGVGVRGNPLPCVPMHGFSSLSRAYHEGLAIDWSKLDGRVARVVRKSSRWYLEYRLHRNPAYPQHKIFGWISNSDSAVGNILNNALVCDNGTELFINGEVPIKRETADKLAAGTFFTGYRNGESPSEFVRYDSNVCGVVKKRVSSLLSNKGGPAEEFVVHMVREGGVIEESC